MKGIACAGAVVVILAWPATAAADVETFVVDTTSASGALTACTGAAADCSLPGAFANANDADPATDEDTISFASSPFDGVETAPGEATVALTADLESDEPLVLNASCANPGPCAGIDAAAGENGISVFGSTFKMSRVAIFGTFSQGLAFLGPGTGLEVTNSYFGLKLDGTVDATDVGLTLTGDNAVVGSIGSAPNFFAGNRVGIQIFAEATDHVIQNNAFGVRPNGAAAGNTAADIMLQGNGGGSDPADITIGAVPNATPHCDAGCNVIAATGGISARGISMEGSGPNTSTASNVDILGNHIGINALGTASLGTAQALVDVGEADDVTISGNRIAGGGIGVFNSGIATNLSIEENSFGLNAAGDTVLGGPTTSAIDLSGLGIGASIARNRMAMPDGGVSPMIVLEESGATIDENVIGLQGAAGSGGVNGIYIEETAGAGVIEENSISETTGHAIELDAASSADITGNEIGVDGPIGGHGIYVKDNDPFSAQFNTIGGASEARANVINNVAGDAIRIQGSGADFNTIEVNLGANAGGLFLNLGGGANESIPRPRITSVERDAVEGEGDPDAKIWLFRSRSNENEFPTGLSQLIGKKNVKNNGTWRLEPASNIGNNTVVTALQTDADLNSSELTKGEKR